MAKGVLVSPDIETDVQPEYMTNARDYIPFGSDNLFPQHVARLNRKSAVNRGILHSKVRYIVADGFNYDENHTELAEFVQQANANKEDLRTVLKHATLDKQEFGNGWIQVVTDSNMSFVNVYHVDSTKCRLHSDLKHVIIHNDWARYEGTKSERVVLAKWPLFEQDPEDGQWRSMIQIKDYEPTFEHYGVPGWIAGLDISAIAYKTDKWNISRLDNNYNSSGVLIIDGNFDSDEEAEEVKELYESEFTGEGNTGKVMVMVKQEGDKEGTKFIPIKQDADGDWTKLHAQATSDLIIAHNWFRALTGIADNTGFDTERILNEYQVALNTVITDEQNTMLAVIKDVLDHVGGITLKLDELSYINKPPIKEKPGYMKIWEARKADGMDYDETDPEQNKYIANLTSKNNGPTDNSKESN